MGIIETIAMPFGKLLYFIYNNLAFQNYGVAIIMFTLIIKLLLLPLTLKQLKSTAKMQQLQPQIQELQKRYKNDKETLNAETMKFYKENKYNPASGCLPLIVQLPILFALYRVVIKPLTFMLGKGVAFEVIDGKDITVVQKIIEVINDTVGIDTIKGGFSEEISVIEYLSNVVNSLPALWDKLANLISPEELINMNFLGVNLGLKPTIDQTLLFGDQMSTYLPLLLIPLFATGAMFFSSWLSMKHTAKKPGTDKKMGSSMLYFGPLMTLVFCFQLPASMGLYWIATSAFQVIQQMYVNKVIHGTDSEELKEVKQIENRKK